MKTTIFKSPGNDSHQILPSTQQHLSPSATGFPQPLNLVSPVREAVHSFDKHFPIASVPNRSRFFGSSSVFALSVEVLHHASEKAIISSEHDSLFPMQDECPYEPEQRLAYESFGFPDAVHDHCNVFFSSSNILYGIVDEHTSLADMSFYLALRSSSFLPPTLRRPEAHSYFRVTMMCAIWLRNARKISPSARYGKYGILLRFTTLRGRSDL